MFLSKRYVQNDRPADCHVSTRGDGNVIQAHELTKVIADRHYRDSWVGGFHNTEAVYEFTWEYGNGGRIQEQVVIPFLGVDTDGVDRLAIILDELATFQRVEISDSQRVYTPVVE